MFDLVEKYRQIATAHGAIRKAIVTGKLIRPTECASCSKECKPDGHHPDYSKPLEVEWLCNSCHKEAHAQEWASDRKRRKELLKAMIHYEAAHITT